MKSVSITNLKTNPSHAIFQASDYPVAIESRNEVKAYLVGKNLYEKLISYIEDFIDVQVVKQTNLSQGKDFEKVTKELGI